MKRNDQFIYKRIAGVPYLLPIGQMIADRRSGAALNPTGEYIWEQLKNDLSQDDLIRRSCEFFKAEGEDVELLSRDIQFFISSLNARGMLSGSSNTFKCSCSICRTSGSDVSAINNVTQINHERITCLCNGLTPAKSIFIGGLEIKLYGNPEYFHADFNSFSSRCTVFDPDSIGNEDSMRIDVLDYSDYYPAVSHKSPIINSAGRTIIHHHDLTVTEYPSEYILLFHELEGIEKVYLKKDGSHAVFFCNKKPSSLLRSSLFHAIRMVFLFFALNHDLVMIHSASILYKNQAWLFSGPSGTGKSTHTAIWNRIYGTPYINGDLNLIGVINGAPYVFGTPWCGSSGLFDPQTHLLGGIILLKQSPENRISELTLSQKIIAIQNRVISPIWDQNMLENTLSIISSFTDRIYIKRFFCTKDDISAHIIRQDIDLNENVQPS